MWRLATIALIPARAGSKRLPGKNTKLFAGHPLLAYAIAAAQDSGVFTRIAVSSEDPATWDVAAAYGAEVFPRALDEATDDAPDIRWVRSALTVCVPREESFAILRPTSPFRTAATIRRAYAQFQRTQDTQHSLRAVEPVRQHPYKCWRLDGELKPVFPGTQPDGTPFHSSPTQTLPAVFAQNASLEMAWTWVVEHLGTISGRKVAPFFTEGYEGVDLNTPDDWQYAEWLVATDRVALPALAPTVPARLCAHAARD